MRIFYASDSSPNPAFESNLWRNNLYAPLVDLGHEVIEFEYGGMRKTFQNLDARDAEQRRFIARNRPRLSGELLRQLRAAHATRPIDLLFSYFYDACVMPETIDAIRDMGITTVNWYCNGSYQLHLVSEIAPHYDWCLVPEKFRLPDYAAMGARPLYCQEAANPNIYKPYDVAQEFDVAFVGQAYGERPAYIHHLLESGIDVRVWGQKWGDFTERGRTTQNSSLRRIARLGRRLTSIEGWAHVARRVGGALESRTADKETAMSLPVVTLPETIIGDALSDEEMIKMYSRAKINLGFSTCGDTHLANERIVQVRLRDFEVPMSGGFYMVEYMEELEEFFRVGEEVVCYFDPEDLADKIKFYLTHDAERERIRRAGYERARRDHTWHRRFQNSFQEMGLS
ncbi:MAG: glycosyltransferase [Pyrinomonadaceae bacterium MAG19_C2-C3]|nr:glycosyltransferase [Pyrinomonadaceae bacterium MAG19_C2-C3]